MSHSGARQWRVDCECVPEVAEQRDSQKWQRMHSQVSKRNATYFISEDRLAEDISESELRERLERIDGALVACNVCGSLKRVDT
ncbi:hypothetical protein VB773_01370 [Haloarculaceae archaeon H-GB2-1]|nr:hypothetical protein [Haloarculaceae archaeon H-GB1-1]MEA5406363.1 hypothetical protein [Haloarculaceae archaeon H-GB2-1]